MLDQFGLPAIAAEGDEDVVGQKGHETVEVARPGNPAKSCVERAGRALQLGRAGEFDIRCLGARCLVTCQPEAMFGIGLPSARACSSSIARPVGNGFTCTALLAVASNMAWVGFVKGRKIVSF